MFLFLTTFMKLHYSDSCQTDYKISYPETALHHETSLHLLIHHKLLLEFDSVNSCTAAFRCSAAHSLSR